ncbi:MAG: DUF1634 domain-containing protein [Comamonadaceae bacterium]|nr:MAG: DUF1634 domain-containing protein [Comamonadaceae bacterium]
MSAVLAAAGTIAQSAPQLRYARVLEWGARAGLAVLAASFLASLSGWLPPHVAPQDLPQYWSQPVAVYLAQTASPSGWGWLALLHRGDMLGLAGIAILAGCSAPALLALVPLYLAQRDRAFLALCLLQAAVLVGAASGVVA